MKNKYIPAAAGAVAALVLILFNIKGLIYINDLIRTEMIELSGPLFYQRPPLPEPASGRGYISSFRGLSREFIHAGEGLFFRAERPVSVRELAETIIEKTGIYTLSGLESAIMVTNALQSRVIQPGETVIIPASVQTLMEDPALTPPAEMIFTRGLYFSGHRAASESFFRGIPALKKAGINAVVFDIKDVTGIVTYKSRVPLALKLKTQDKAAIANLPLLLRELKKQGIYSIARLSVFHDQLLAQRAPSLAITSKATGRPWRGSPGERWCDPTNKTVHDYNIELALEVARAGADEIQFDYIRFPTSGDFNDARFAGHFGTKGRDEIITEFLKRASLALKKARCRVSIDIFGVVAWGQEADIKTTGQRVQLLAPHCDAISPMLYPSHFNNNFDGFARPGDNPYYFINAGSKKTATLAGERTVVRPWLQAFKWRVSVYDEKYIHEQIRGAEDAGAGGYLFWNASSDYRVVLRALASMRLRDRKLSLPDADAR